MQKVDVNKQVQGGLVDSCRVGAQTHQQSPMGHIVVGSDGTPVEVDFLTPEGARTPGRPYVEVIPTSSGMQGNLVEAHEGCTKTFTNDWYSGTAPLCGCQGIFSVGPVLYYKLCALFGIVTGFYNRAWERKGQRCFWWSPEMVDVPESTSGFTKVKPTQPVLLVVPGIPDGYVAKLVVPAYAYDRSYCALHGICGEVNVERLEDPAYLLEIYERDLKTWHFEKGGDIEVCILRNTPKSSAGIYVDPCDNEHFEKQCALFRQQRADPKRKTPRAYTAEATVSQPDWHVVALYMLHRLPTAHVHFGKVVADPAGLAGNGFISNRGKLKDVRTKAGVPITSKTAYEAARKAGDLAPVQADFLIQGDFVHSAEEIINSMSPQQQAYFSDTLVPALRIVETKGAAYYYNKL